MSGVVAAGDPELARKVRDRQDLVERVRYMEDHLADETEPTPSMDEQRQDWQVALDNFVRHVTVIAG